MSGLLSPSLRIYTVSVRGSRLDVLALLTLALSSAGGYTDLYPSRGYDAQTA